MAFLGPSIGFATRRVVQPSRTWSSTMGCSIARSNSANCRSLLLLNKRYLSTAAASCSKKDLRTIGCHSSVPTPSRLLATSSPFLNCRRTFKHTAGSTEGPKPQTTPVQTTIPPPTSIPPSTSTKSTEDQHPTKAEQRRSDWAIIKKLIINVWPKNDWKTRATVLLGLALLVSAKVRMNLYWLFFINECAIRFLTFKFRKSSNQ